MLIDLLSLFPYLVMFQDQGKDILGGRGSDGGSGGGAGSKLPKIPVLGLYQTQSTAKGGRVVVYGDSNCVDNSHLNSKVGSQIRQYLYCRLVVTMNTNPSFSHPRAPQSSCNI